MMSRFKDRHEAGLRLAESLFYDPRLKELTNLAILGLPRGGVPVAYELAKMFRAELGVIVTRKLGVPGHEELAFGAIGPEGVRVLDDDIMRDCGVTKKEVEDIVLRETHELKRRQLLYQGRLDSAKIRGRSVIVVDDGIATGATMKAAVMAVRKLGAAKVIVAVPVGPQDARQRLGSSVDDYYCLQSPALFSSVGEWYQDFSQTSDEEVLECLRPMQEIELNKSSPVVPV